MNAAVLVNSYFNWVSVRFRINSAPITERHFFISAPRKLTDKFLIILLPIVLATLWAFNAQNNGVPWLIGALLGFIFGACTIAALTFFLYALDIIFCFCASFYAPFLIPILLFFNQEPHSHVFYLFTFTAAALSFLISWFLIPATFISAARTLAADKDRQAHFLFVASMALLGWGLWLQNGGNWQSMAVFNAPVVLPVVHWKIPFTESAALPFALFGFVHDPAGAVVSTVAHAPLNTTLALFAAAAVLFFFAVQRLQYSVVGVRPALAWWAFALGCAAVYLDVALHWGGAPVLPPELILFNRAFAVLALGVYLFWRSKARIGLPVPGADGEYQKAFDMADHSARMIALWLLGLLWVATQFSRGWGGEVPELVRTVLIMVLVAFPVRHAVKFNREFRGALGRYDELLTLFRQSYKPPSTVASDEQVRDALNGGRGIGGKGPDGKDWNDTGD